MSYQDSWFLVLIIAMGLSFYSQMKISTTFGKYSKVRSMSGKTGSQVAKEILARNAIYDVRVEPVRGQLTDHYDPMNKVLRLSESVHDSSSIAAVAVAAHECGHAIQHNVGYVPLNLRSAIAPVASIGSRFAWIMILAGFAISSRLIDLGIMMYLAIVIFQVVTLPVEINASRRALTQLNDGIIPSEENYPAKKVLEAAALTYIAATLVAIGELLRLLAMTNRRRDD